MTFELSYEICIFKIMSKALALPVTSADLKCQDVRRIKFYLSKMRTAAQKNTSYSSEKLLQRDGVGTVSIYDFGEGRVHATKHIFF